MLFVGQLLMHTTQGRSLTKIRFHHPAHQITSSSEGIALETLSAGLVNVNFVR